MEKLMRAAKPTAEKLSTSVTTSVSPTLAAMQKRAELARRQNERKKSRRKAYDNIPDEMQRREGRTLKHRAEAKLIVAERKARREDWELGPLAPRRDLGPKGHEYGLIHPMIMEGVTKKDPRDFGIREGDRVVIVNASHRDYGRIGKVMSLEKESEQCSVENINRCNLQVEEWQLLHEADKTPFRAYTLPMPLSSVRLVAPMTDPVTGMVQDTVVKKIKVISEEFKDGITIPERRIVAGVRPEIDIPFPGSDQEPEELPDADCDTVRLQVEDRTWTPTLSVPPMPTGIIDELRNKYSALRIRHDDAWIAAKDKEFFEKEEHQRSLKQRTITPMDELAMKRKAEKLAQGEPEISEEMLESIGKIMAKNLGIDPSKETKLPQAAEA